MADTMTTERGPYHDVTKRRLDRDVLMSALADTGTYVQDYARICGLSRHTVAAALAGRPVRFRTALAMSRGYELLRRLPRAGGGDAFAKLTKSAPSTTRRRRRRAER
jgi:hypothetical protein